MRITLVLLLIALLAGAVCADPIQWRDCPLSTSEPASKRGLPEDEDVFPSINLPSPGQKNREFQHRVEKNLLSKLQKHSPVKRDFTSDVAKCANIQVPLDHSEPTGPQISIFVKCYVSESTTGQMWVLQGGPGGSSSGVEFLMKSFADELGNTYDVCTMDHRGVDRSSSLDCKATQALTPGSPGGCDLDVKEAPQCAAEINDVSSTKLFSATQAAHDLGFVIQAYGKSNAVVYGVSYGTFWVARFAQNYPDLATALIFDSVTNPVGPLLYSFDKWDIHTDDTLKLVLAWCGEDSFCRQKLGKDPVAFARRALKRVFEEGSCPPVSAAIPSAVIFSSLLGALVQNSFTRVLIPALLYRIDRCRQGDLLFLGSLAELLAGPQAPSASCPTDMNPILYTNVVAQEIFDPSQTLESLTKQNAGLDFFVNASIHLFDVKSHWTGYFDFEHYNTSVKTNSSVLVLGGEYDGQTPVQYSRAFSKLVQSSNPVFYAESSRGNHAVSLELGSNMEPCGVSVITAFVRDPLTQPDTSCLKAPFQYGFPKGISLINQLVFGVSDLFDGVPEQEEMPGAAVFPAMVALAIITSILVVVVIALAVAYRRKTQRYSMVGMAL